MKSVVEKMKNISNHLVSYNFLSKQYSKYCINVWFRSTCMFWEETSSSRGVDGLTVAERCLGGQGSLPGAGSRDWPVWRTCINRCPEKPV